MGVDVAGCVIAGWIKWNGLDEWMNGESRERPASGWLNGLNPADR